MHIDLRNWADLILIAPLSAHTLAKMAQGLCDDTLSCVFRAWDFGHYTASKRNDNIKGTLMGKPVLLAPAMNTAMWEHPLTSQHLQAVQSFGSVVQVIEPQVKMLACGEEGNGALASVDVILEAVRQALACISVDRRST